MGEWLIWLVLGSLIVIMFCIYSLSNQVERCARLTVEIITGHQRKIIEQLEAMTGVRNAAVSPNVVPFERRRFQRRRTALAPESQTERRRSSGRRHDDRPGFS
ncbi:MAG: hypothetical protein IT531_02425 [Burkholderiales bacterium]|nr:hypothetical protein [Burkholderiales bacterium]